MKTFKALCEAYNEFKEVVEKKCNEYCTIHKCENPFKESDTPVEIYTGTDISLYYTINDRCGCYDCKTLEIPYTFFESDEHSEEEQKYLKKAAQISDLTVRKNELFAERKELEKTRDTMKCDLEDMSRLSSLYGIVKSPEFEIAYRRYNDEVLPALKTNIRKCELIAKQIKEINNV